jgi:hypothetical protein
MMRNSVANLTNLFERALFAPSLSAIDELLDEGFLMAAMHPRRPITSVRATRSRPPAIAFAYSLHCPVTAMSLLQLLTGLLGWLGTRTMRWTSENAEGWAEKVLEMVREREAAAPHVLLGRR